MTLPARLLLACVLGYIAAAGVPRTIVPQPATNVERPSEAMQGIVDPVAKQLARLTIAERMAWAEVWTKAAIVVEGDAVAVEVAFTDTRSMRAFTSIALDIAWRRIGGHEPGTNEALRAAVEGAYAKAIGVAVAPVTADTRKQFSEFARAMAWAGLNRG